MAHRASRTTSRHLLRSPRGADFECAHSSVVLGKDVPDRRRGFTIVELLIVVVVIAILAAITIVAYNGITNRAKATAAATAAEQAAKKVMMYAAVNSDQYPASLADAGVSDGSATYQYRVDNSANPKTFCITATKQSVSSYVSSSSATPTAGVCAGHGAAGQTVITNLARDPRATTYAQANGALTWRSARWFGGGGGAGAYTLMTGASDGPVGISSYARKTWTTGPGSYAASGDTGFDTGYSGTAAFPVSEGNAITISCFLRASLQRGFQIGVYQYSATGAAYSPARIYGPEVVGTPNVWSRVSYTYTPPTGVAFAYFVCDSGAFVTNGPANWTVGSTLDGTGLMVTEGSTLHAYADGNSPGWVWNGTPNSSTSTGPAL